ncbi:MAG: HNH endonuclease signature motif containing protein [Acidimicrobiales bacterium]
MAHVTYECVETLDEAVSCLGSSAGEASDAAGLVEALVPVRRRLDAIVAALAARAAAQKVHQQTGHKDEVQWLARTTGVSRRSAKDQLDTERRLEDLPQLRQAREKGQLSQAQADLVARAAEADPGRQKQLLGAARREDLKGLRQECERVIAAADEDQSATYARVKRDRSVKTWRQNDGVHCLLAKGTADDIGALSRRIDKQANAVMDRARKAGRREPYEAYRFDALLELTHHSGTSNGSGGDAPPIVPPKRDVLIHIDWSAAKRGHTISGETCEIAGVGPVPVEVALDFDADPFIKAVIRDGTDVRTVVHYGRSVPAELRTALEARGMRCAAPGCSNDAHLEVDHALVDFADGGPLALWNTQWLCSHHHRLKTEGVLDLDLRPPQLE